MSKHILDNLCGVTNYNGVLIWRNGSGYSLWGNYYSSPKEVDKAIANAQSALKKSLTIQNKNGSISVTNTENDL